MSGLAHALVTFPLSCHSTPPSPTPPNVVHYAFPSPIPEPLPLSPSNPPAFLYVTLSRSAMKSVETREHLVRMVLEQGRGVAAAAHDLNMSVLFASRFLGYCRDTGGDFHYDPVKWNRHFNNLADDPQLREAVLSAVREQPEMCLDELADAVNEIAAQIDGAVDVTPATVARELERNWSTRKVVEKAFISRNETDRVAWVAMQWQIPLRCRVYCGSMATRRPSGLDS